MYIIWSLINAAFVILFFALVLTLFTKGKKLFNNRYGNPIIIILILGVFGILSSKNKEFENTHVFSYDKEIKTTSGTHKTIRLEENTASTLLADIRLKENNQGELVPIYVMTMYNGFVGGHEWELMSATINSNDDGTFTYDFSGLTHWSLFGIGLYTQNKDFKGKFELEEY